jgi:xylulokinase
MSFLSIDVGSSRCKAAIFSSRGELVGMRSAYYAPCIPAPGFAELGSETFVTIATGVARELACLPANEPVEAVCFSSHGETVIPVSADGRALGPAILNIDMRATKEAAWLEKEIGRRQLFSLTGHTSHAMYPLLKLLWLRNNAPDLFAATARFAGVTDFLLLGLGLPPYVDYSHASRFMAFDVQRRAWAKEMLQLAGISADTLPIPVQAGTVAGKLSSEAAARLGVGAGTPVVVGGHDQVIGAVGMGVIGAGRAAGSLGTYECILVVSDQLHLNDAALDSSLNSYPHAVEGQFVTIAYFPAGIMTQWLANLLYGQEGGETEQHFKELESSSPARPTGLLITPHLIGSCNPEFDPEARSTIQGLSLESSRSHFYKGILEGIASELALITECLESAGCAFSDINVSGGGARSPLGLKLRAAFTKRRLHSMSCDESVCLGGAMLASVAVGAQDNLQAAAKCMTEEKECVTPDPDLAEQYRPQIERYRRLRSMLVHRHDPKSE